MSAEALLHEPVETRFLTFFMPADSDSDASNILTMSVRMTCIRDYSVKGIVGMGKRLKKQGARALIVGMASSIAIAAAGPALGEQDEANYAERRSFAAQAGPLGDVLFAITAAFDVNIIADEAIVEGKTSSTVSGAMTAAEAVDRVLDGTGLVAEQSASGAFVIVETGGSNGVADSDPSPAQEIIIVTGQQIDRSLQETKESVALVTAQDIKDLELLDINDALVQTANVAITGTGVQNFAIRGVARPSFANGGVGDLGIIFYDDVAITGNALNFIQQNLWDVQQLEFLRGPQSTNVGRNALAGAVVIRSAAPKIDAFEAATRVEYGSYDTYAVEGMVNMPVTSNSAVRLTAERSETEGFIENTFLDDDGAGGSDFATARAQFLIEPGDRFTAKASLQYTDGRRSDASYIVQDGAPRDTYETRYNVKSFFEFEGVNGSLNLQYDLSDSWRFQAITAFLDGEYYRETDNDLTEADLGIATSEDEQSNISQELKVFYSGESFSGVFGGYYLYDESDTLFISTGAILASLVGVPGQLAPFYPTSFVFENLSDSTSETENIAFFTQWDVALSDRFELSAGLRYDLESRSSIIEQARAVSESTPLPDPAAAGASAEAMTPGSGAAVEAGVAQLNAGLNALLAPDVQSFDADYEALLPEIGLTYILSSDLNVSAFYKRGYRAGGSRIEATGALNEFDPEFLDNFELSLRSQWLDNRLTVNANAYYGLWTDQQLNVPVDGNTQNTRTINAGESTIWGFELETAYRPTPATRLFANLGYARTEFEEFCRLGSTATDLPDCTIEGGNGKDLAGNDFGLSPDWTVSVGGRKIFFDTYFIQANITHQSEFFGDPENSPDLKGDAITLLNASIGYEADTFAISFYGRNITDEFYDTSPFRGLGGERGVVPGAPSQYGVIVSKSF